MPEEQQFQGERWTNKSMKLLSSLGWTQVGDSNFDVPCVNKSIHRTLGDKPRVNPHGIDLLFKFNDPFQESKDIGVVVESKHRQWSGISKSSIEEFCNQILMTMECVQKSPIINDLGMPRVKSGLVMIWCHETDLFDEEKFNDYLSNVEISIKRAPSTIYVASNNEILRWASIASFVEQKRASTFIKSFDFFYPSDNFSKGNSKADRKEHVTLAYLFSKYIFAKSVEIENHRGGTRELNVNHVFFFDKPSKKVLNLVYNLIRSYQFEDADEIIFHFYGENTQYRADIAEFLRNKENELGENNTLKITCDYINMLANVPE